jgi:type II secretory pathway component PulF
MAVFEYRAVGAAGTAQKGLLEAQDLDRAIDRVRGMGLTPVTIEPRPEDGRARGWARFSLPPRRARASELILFTRQLETMLEAGLPLLSTLETLHEQATDPALREAIDGVRSDVEQGSTLTEAMERRPHCFPPVYAGLIRAGEEGGLLTPMLDRVGTILEYQEETRQRIRSATFYPLLVVAELLAAFVILVKLVLPRFADLFRNLGADLPLPTRVLIAVSDGFERSWVLLLALGALAAGGAVLAVRTDRGREIRDSWLLAVPLFGSIVRKVALARFARVLGALVESGIPIVRALGIARGVLGNRVLEAEIDRMRDGLVEGRGLAEPLRGSRVIPPLVTKMLSVGEETGSIGPMLTRVARYYDRDVDYAVKNLSAALEPALLVVLGVSVLFTALAVFLPLWNLMSAFRH